MDNKRLKLIKTALLPLVMFCLSGWTTISIDFRATAGYVTDPANATYSLCNSDASYAGGPVNRGGATFGWTAVYADAERDRSSSVSDKRFAGVCQRPNTGTQAVFRLDVTAGTYDVWVAMGDADNDQSYQHVEIYDNATLRGTMNDTDGTTTGNFDDSTGTQYSVANFYSSGVKFSSVSLSSGIFIMKVGTTSNVGGNSTPSHITLTAVSSSPSLLPILHAGDEY